MFLFLLPENPRWNPFNIDQKHIKENGRNKRRTCTKKGDPMKMILKFIFFPIWFPFWLLEKLFWPVLIVLGLVFWEWQLWCRDWFTGSGPASSANPAVFSVSIIRIAGGILWRKSGRNIPCVVLYADYRSSRTEFSVLHAGCCFCARQTEAWYADDAENDLLCMDAERDLFFQVTDQGGRRSETSICVVAII